MEPILAQVLAEMQRLLESSRKVEEQCISQIMALEAITNRSLKCLPQPVHKPSTKKEEKKVEEPTFSAQAKIEALVEHIESAKLSIETTGQLKKEEKPVEKVEKKPPVPTEHRSQKAAARHIPAYHPPAPRRNEPTGKVTQTVVRTNANQVFRPNKNSASKQQSRSRETLQPISKAGPVQKRSLQKKAGESRGSTSVSSIQKQEAQSNKEIESKQQVRKVEEAPIKGVRLETFQRDQQGVVEGLLQRGANHRRQLEKYITDCENQELGTRKNEEASRVSFLRAVNNYAASRQGVHPYYSDTMTRKRLNYQPELLYMGDWLQELERVVRQWEENSDCRIDPKEQFKVVHSIKKYQTSVEHAIEQLNTTFPEQIQLAFDHQLQGKGSSLQQAPTQASLSTLNDHLHSLLESISERDSLQRQDLRALQVLSQLTQTHTKKAPLVVYRQQFMEWESRHFGQQ